MKKYSPFVAFVLLALFVLSCTKPPNYPDEPELTFVRFSKNVIAQGNRASKVDTLELVIGFTDGDGDIGHEDTNNLFLVDSRSGFREVQNVKPIPKEGTGNGISGEIILKIINTPFNICCTFPDTDVTCVASTQHPTDTFSYTVQIMDRAGNMSNKLQTEMITILCN